MRTYTNVHEHAYTKHAVQCVHIYTKAWCCAVHLRSGIRNVRSSRSSFGYSKLKANLGCIRPYQDKIEAENMHCYSFDMFFVLGVVLDM